MTDLERAFLSRLAGMKFGRCSYALVNRDGVMEIVGALLAGGYVRERRLGHDEGLQITPLGKEYLGGVQS
jgi:hypothetical protein